MLVRERAACRLRFCLRSRRCRPASHRLSADMLRARLSVASHAHSNAGFRTWMVVFAASLQYTGVRRCRRGRPDVGKVRAHPHLERLLGLSHHRRCRRRVKGVSGGSRRPR